MKRIILASASPRRIKMMRSNGYVPEIIPADVNESLPFDMSPQASVMYLAFKKAHHTAVSTLSREPAAYSGKDNFCDDAIVIAADTVVLVNGCIIGKPSSQQEAFDTLQAMRNSHHSVMTGVCILNIASGRFTNKTCLYEKTDVYFSDYSDEELLNYVKTSEPYDKAGGYAIQGTFGRYIDHIDGDYDNVVGFPWKRVEPFLKDR